MSDLGCGTATDEVTICLYKTVRAPNVFSPNGDGINDSWVISGLDSYPESIVKVYSRGGQLVFQSKANEKNWDGNFNNRRLPVGTYYYLIDLNIGQPQMSGWVVIIR
mgnify:CR=1 FL=1